MRHHFRLWGTLAGLSLLLLFLGGCLDATPLAGVDRDSWQLPAYGLVTPRKAAAIILALEDNPNFVLLDIRTPAEVESGHISGAQNLDFYSPTFEQDLKKLDRDKIYLIYCRSGNRTGQARALMQELGFSKVYDLDGSINAWNNLSYPICLGPLTRDTTAAVSTRRCNQPNLGFSLLGVRDKAISPRRTRRALWGCSSRPCLLHSPRMKISYLTQRTHAVFVALGPACPVESYSTGVHNVGFALCAFNVAVCLF